MSSFSLHSNSEFKKKHIPLESSQLMFYSSLYCLYFARALVLLQVQEHMTIFGSYPKHQYHNCEIGLHLQEGQRHAIKLFGKLQSNVPSFN